MKKTLTLWVKMARILGRFRADFEAFEQVSRILIRFRGFWAGFEDFEQVSTILSRFRGFWADFEDFEQISRILSRFRGFSAGVEDFQQISSIFSMRRGFWSDFEDFEPISKILPTTRAHNFEKQQRNKQRHAQQTKTCGAVFCACAGRLRPTLRAKNNIRELKEKHV